MDEKKQLQLLQQLNYYEPFQLWREMVVKGTIDTLEQELNNADEMPEPILRAKLKHISSLKYFFNDVFANIDAHLQQEKEQE